MGQILTPDRDRAMTPKQSAAAVSLDDLPPCAANPNAVCPTGTTDFMVKGYDDKYRCKLCNDLHIELVMHEAGESSPNAQPQFVAPKLDRRAEKERQARINALNQKLADGGVDPVGQKHGQTRGSKSVPTNENFRQLQPGEAVDMRDIQSKDEHKTREQGISESERRARILAKYGKRVDGNKLVR